MLERRTGTTRGNSVRGYTDGLTSRKCKAYLHTFSVPDRIVYEKLLSPRTNNLPQHIQVRQLQFSIINCICCIIRTSPTYFTHSDFYSLLQKQHNCRNYFRVPCHTIQLLISSPLPSPKPAPATEDVNCSNYNQGKLMPSLHGPARLLSRLLPRHFPCCILHLPATHMIFSSAFKGKQRNKTEPRVLTVANCLKHTPYESS